MGNTNSGLGNSAKSGNLGNSDSPKRVQKRYSLIIRFIVKLLFIVLTVYIVFTYVLCVKRVGNNSMHPAIKDGDLCIFYRLSDYSIGDVVLYTDGSSSRVCRIVAMEGQEVDFPKDGGYTIDGYSPSEDIAYKTYNIKRSKIKYPLKIPKDGVFLLNDFRTDTLDSRELGVVSKENVQGTLIFVLRRRNF